MAWFYRFSSTGEQISLGNFIFRYPLSNNTLLPIKYIRQLLSICEKQLWVVLCGAFNQKRANYIKKKIYKTIQLNILLKNLTVFSIRQSMYSSTQYYPTNRKKN
jgi:hypothetical protein